MNELLAKLERELLYGWPLPPPMGAQVEALLRDRVERLCAEILGACRERGVEGVGGLTTPGERR